MQSWMTSESSPRPMTQCTVGLVFHVTQCNTSFACRVFHVCQRFDMFRWRSGSYATPSCPARRPSSVGDQYRILTASIVPVDPWRPFLGHLEFVVMSFLTEQIRAQQFTGFQRPRFSKQAPDSARKIQQLRTLIQVTRLCLEF